MPIRIYGVGWRLKEKGRNASGSSEGNAKANITDLLLRLDLMEDEEAVLNFSDNEGDAVIPLGEWAVVGKVLLPTTVNVNIVRAAKKPAQGTLVVSSFEPLEREVTIYLWPNWQLLFRIRLSIIPQ